MAAAAGRLVFFICAPCTIAVALAAYVSDIGGLAVEAPCPGSNRLPEAPVSPCAVLSLQSAVEVKGSDSLFDTGSAEASGEKSAPLRLFSAPRVAHVHRWYRSSPSLIALAPKQGPPR